eukprot:CAMPEP_0194209638 /NCGR_PEP_ID=MMETSP0156-20130528/7691_1 /TAXON_ID=33649 /ORGANISM="Thalassionema nitzschioides, Strain L26-B" /LENGTH=76 /DNA_ID=CAMNT_0038936839 /DNA_START=232 /DNA_END=462 /DNA_ORIENTATION=+
MKYFGYATFEENDANKEIKLMGIPVIQRKENEIEEVKLSEHWNKTFRKEMSEKKIESKESRKVENKRDVANPNLNN